MYICWINEWMKLRGDNFCLPSSLLVYSPTCPPQILIGIIANFQVYYHVFFLSGPPKNFKSINQNLFVERTNGRRKMDNPEVHNPVSSISAGLRPWNRKYLPRLSFIYTMGTIIWPQYYRADGVYGRGSQTAKHHTKFLLTSFVRFCELPYQSLASDMHIAKCCKP